MNTPSHLIMTLALKKSLKRISIPNSAIIWGSLAPDLPLYFFSFVGWIYGQKVLGMTLSEVMDWMYGDLFFNHPLWIAGHHALHSPLFLGLLICFNLCLFKKSGAQFLWIQCFLLASLLHSVVDVLTHYDDGPLLLFPFEWSLRFQSPISYWDQDHHASSFMIFEILLCIVCLVYIFYRRKR